MLDVKQATAGDNVSDEGIEIAQISDCHLYQDKNTLHYGANVYRSLCQVLVEIRENKNIACVIFTGDLTQDHSEQSYLNFVDAIVESKLTLPVYYTPGNHDQPELLSRLLTLDNIYHEKTVEFAQWQIQLINSKSDKPSGVVSHAEGQRLLKAIKPAKNQLLFMHHHAKDANYFIDRHGLKNKTEFYALLDNIPQLKALACGHVHNALELTIKTRNKQLALYTCPATSIQFDKTVDGVANSELSAGYRLFQLSASGQLISESCFLAPA